MQKFTVFSEDICQSRAAGRMMNDVNQAAANASTATGWRHALTPRQRGQFVVLVGMWVATGIFAPWSDVADDTIGLVVSIWGWAGWIAVLAALLVPSAISLTVARNVAPLAIIAAVVAGNPWASATASVAWLLVLSAGVCDALVQGGAYGHEMRLVLRTPVPYLAPAIVTWALYAGSAIGGTLALAGRQWLVGAALTVVALVLTVRVPRRLHRLSRRWLVVVPAGVVVHDHMVLSETMMVRRANITGVQAALAAGEAADLTGGVTGARLLVSMREADKVLINDLTAKMLGVTTGALHVQSYAIAPRRLTRALQLLDRS